MSMLKNEYVKKVASLTETFQYLNSIKSVPDSMNQAPLISAHTDIQHLSSNVIVYLMVRSEDHLYNIITK